MRGGPPKNNQIIKKITTHRQTDIQTFGPIEATCRRLKIASSFAILPCISMCLNSCKRLDINSIFLDWGNVQKLWKLGKIKILPFLRNGLSTRRKRPRRRLIFVYIQTYHNKVCIYNSISLSSDMNYRYKHFGLVCIFWTY